MPTVKRVYATARFLVSRKSKMIFASRGTFVVRWEGEASLLDRVELLAQAARWILFSKPMGTHEVEFEVAEPEEDAEKTPPAWSLN